MKHCSVQNIAMPHPAITALPHKLACHRILPILLNDYLCFSTEYIQPTGQKQQAYYLQFKLSTAQINSNIVAACFNVRNNKQVVIWRQVPSATYAGVSSGKVNFS
jgi:hypothetical protein